MLVSLRLAYDEDGQSEATSMLDYAIPRARTLPCFEPLTPRGAKDGSEAGCLGAPAAILCVVLDARRSPAVWQALQQARA